MGIISGGPNSTGSWQSSLLRSKGKPGNGKGTVSIGTAYLWESVLVNSVHLALVLVFGFVVTVLDKASVL